MRILVIDGQGGKMGAAIVSGIKSVIPEAEVVAVGTNSIATSVMLKAGADSGATGENPVLVLAGTANIIIGPLGIVIADALMGEITAKMAEAVSKSVAKKILIPVNKCNTSVVGVRELTLGEYVELAIKEISG